jgi:hypothetical protein
VHWRSRYLGVAVSLASALLLPACQEPEPPRATLGASRAVEVGLVASTLSPASGDTLVVLARLTAGVDVRPAASFTLRLSYDPTRLAYVGDVTRAGDAMRVVNAEIPGDLRVAGISSQGFQTGELMAWRFVSRAAGGVGALQLAVDQLHATDGEDLARAVVRAPVVDAQVAR